MAADYPAEEYSTAAAAAERAMARAGEIRRRCMPKFCQSAVLEASRRYCPGMSNWSQRVPLTALPYE